MSVSFLISLFALLREFVVGRKIHEDGSKKKRFSVISVVDLLQNSRRAAIAIVVVLLLSLFVNYRAIMKLHAAQPPRDERATENSPIEPGIPKEVATLPKAAPERETSKDRAPASELLLNIYGN